MNIVDTNCAEAGASRHESIHQPIDKPLVKAPSIWGIPLSPEQYTFVEAESTWRGSHTFGAHFINRYYSCTLIISLYLQHLKREREREETKPSMTNDKYLHI